MRSGLTGPGAGLSLLMTDRTNAFDPPDLPLRATLKRMVHRRLAHELSQLGRWLTPVRSSRRDVAAAGT